jgi:putative oxidoreductase
MEPHSALTRLLTGRQTRAMNTLEDTGKLLLRLCIGLLILAHGVAKIGGGTAVVVDMVQKMGLPGELGYLVLVGEVLAPLLLIAGVWTRVAALLVAANMVVAVALVHMKELFKLGEQGGYALELQAMFLFGALAVAMLGAGRFSLGGARGRFN